MGVRDKLYAPTYMDKVLEIQSPNLLAYWPLNEKSGGVAHDRSGHDRHGAYTGVTLGQPGIGDGNRCPYFDGVNDFVNIYSVSLRDAFNGAEGTAMIWLKVFNAGVWTDGASRRTLLLQADGNNRVYPVSKSLANNTILLFYKAGGVTEFTSQAGHSELTFLFGAITWSKSAGASGEVKFFVDGVQVAATATTLGIWAGPLSATNTIIGADATTGGQVWHGWLAHGAVWDTPLTPTQIAQLAVVT